MLRMLLLLVLASSCIFAAPQIPSPLVPGSTFSSAIDPLDNLFVAAPSSNGAGLGMPLVQVNPPPNAANPATPKAPNQPAPVTPGNGGAQSPVGAAPAPGTPPNAAAPLNPATTAPRNNATAPSAALNATSPTRNATLEKLAPGTTNVTATTEKAKDAGSPDSGLGGLVTAGIVVGGVVLASMIGIFLFRKWKLRPKERSSRWRKETLDQWHAASAVPQSTLPLHQAMQQHQNYARSESPGSQVGGYGTPAGAGGTHGLPTATYAPASHHVATNAHQEMHGEMMFQPPAHARTVEMDLALRHHLRNG